MSQSNLNSELKLLISFGVNNLPRILALIKEGADVNTRNLQGNTALHACCVRGENDIAKLLELGADVNIQSKTLFTPIMSASANSSHESVKALINAKSDIHLRSFDGATALSLACQRSDVDIVRSLLLAGADIDEQDGYGNTPLMIAVDNDSLKLVKFLMEEGADTSIVNNSGKRALDIASDEDDIVRDFIEQAVLKRELESSASRESCVSHVFTQSR